MKKRSIYFMLSGAVALAGIFGISSCSSSDDVAVNNPNYNPETNEVLAEFVFNVSTGNTATTRQSSAATQASISETFRGIDNAVLIGVVVFSNPSIRMLLYIPFLFRRYSLYMVFFLKFSAIVLISSYIHLLTPPKVQSFPRYLQLPRYI